MRHDQSQRIAVFGAEGFTVMMRRKQYLFAIQIGERHICRVSLLAVNQNVTCGRFRMHSLEDLPKGDSNLSIVKAVSTGNAVEVTHMLNFGERIEFGPGPSHGSIDQSVRSKVPSRRIKPRHRPVLKHRPLQGEGLPGWQSPLLLHL